MDIPPSASGITTMTGTNYLAAAGPYSCLSKWDAEHGLYNLSVPASLGMLFCSVLWNLKIYQTGAFVGLGLVFLPVTAVNWIALSLAPHPGPGILFPYHREQNPSDTGITVTYKSLYLGKVAVHGGAFLSLLSLFVCYHCTTMVCSGQVTSLWWGWKVSVKSRTSVLRFANIFPVVS